MSRGGEPVESDERLLPPETTLLDLVDNLLDKGLLVHGEIVLGLAGVDLVYVGLSAVICAADRLRTPRASSEEPPR